MTELLLYGALALLLLAGAIRLLLHSGARTASSSAWRGRPAEFFPVHSRYFPQMRWVFSADDAEFLSARCSPVLLRRWKADRRRAARLYLHALREDFARLNRLARLLARHSRRLDPKQQAQVVWLNLQFQALWRLALLQVILGLPAAGELGRMTELVGTLGGRLEKAAITLDASSAALTP